MFAPANCINSRRIEVYTKSLLIGEILKYSCVINITRLADTLSYGVLYRRMEQEYDEIRNIYQNNRCIN